MKKLSFLLPVLIHFILFTNVSGQDIYKEGFVITNENDTLHGLIRDCGTMRNAALCFFKEDHNSNVIRYRPEDIKSYLIKNDKYYSSQHLYYKDQYQKVFVEVLLEGKFDLFYVRNAKNRSYYIKKDDGNLKPLYVEDLFVTRAQDYGKTTYVSERYDIRLALYKDTLISLFDESEEIQSQVKNITYEPKPIINITKAYLAETCKSDDCIVFEKKFIKKHSFGLYAGFQFSDVTNDLSSSSGYSIPAGIFYNRILSPINERLSLQFELVRRSMYFNNGFSGLPDTVSNRLLELNMIGLPILLKYRTSVKRLSPVVVFGKEFGYLTYSKITDYNRNTFSLEPFHTYDLSKILRSGWFFELGADYKLNQKISLFSNIRLQQYSNRVNRISYQFEPEGVIKYTSYNAALLIGISF